MATRTRGGGAYVRGFLFSTSGLVVAVFGGVTFLLAPVAGTLIAGTSTGAVP